MLAGNKAGWAALCRLVSATHLRGERGVPVTTRRLVAEHLSGSFGPDDQEPDLLVMLGPASELGWAATLRRDDLARGVLRSWQQVTEPTQLLVEVVSHRVPGSGPGSSAHAARMAALAASTSLGVESVVLTNAVRYAERSRCPAVDVLDAVRRLVPLDVRHVDRSNAEGFLKSGKQMADVADEICRLAGFDQREAERTADPHPHRGRPAGPRPPCRPRPRRDPLSGARSVESREQAHKPRFVESVASGVGDAALRARCEAGIGRRYAPAQHAVVQTRLADELGVIAQLGYASYFLTVADVVDLIGEMGVRAAARGSGAGSLVNYLLGISGVDPLRYGLLMERFLSPLRQALPDIDVDVESPGARRSTNAILERYAGNRCACVSMMDTYRVRHAIRDVGAALGHAAGRDRRDRQGVPAHPGQRRPGGDARAARAARSPGSGGRSGSTCCSELVEKLDGLPRHIAMHPCGVLLSDATLLDRTPVEASFLGFPMSQFDKDDVEDLGLLKLDVLGIRMQSAMAHAVAEVAPGRRRRDRPRRRGAGAARRPGDVRADPGTKTLGCFQIESPGQRELVGKFRPRRSTTSSSTSRCSGPAR